MKTFERVVQWIRECMCAHMFVYDRNDTWICEKCGKTERFENDA